MAINDKNVNIYNNVILENGYTDIVKLGEGMFGIVFKVKKDDKLYAIKCEKPVFEFDKKKITEIKIKKINEKKNFDEIVNSKLKHPNITCHYSYFFGKLTEFNNQEVSFIVMELCKCSLQQWFIDNAQNREYRNCLKMFEGIVNGLQHIHEHAIIHRDLKPGNILISIDGVICKIADFGFSKNTFDDATFTRRHGTPLYSANELINDTDKHYDYKVDIYSLGCIFMEFFSEFNDNKELEKALKNLRKQILPKNFFNAVPDKSETAKALAISMTEKNPINRAPIQKILYEFKQLCIDFFKTVHEDKHAKEGQQQETGIRMFTSKGRSNEVEVEIANITAFKGVSTEDAIRLSKNANISMGISDGEGNKVKIGKLTMRAVDSKSNK